MSTNVRINLWSSPRNISTAMMYSFAQREDTLVFDEPLYAHYLETTGITHPGTEDILKSQDKNGENIIRNIILANHAKPIAFYKQMTHHLENISLGFLSFTQNIIFIRNPKQIIASYSQVRKEVTLQDVGIKKQWWLYNYLLERKLPCIVLDSSEILHSPKNVLQQLCDALKIPFTDKMLHWPPGPKPYDGIWAKYWYENVHRSTGFALQKTSERELPSYLEPLYEECKIFYQQLFPLSIKAA